MFKKILNFEFSFFINVSDYLIFKLDLLLKHLIDCTNIRVQKFIYLRNVIKSTLNFYMFYEYLCMI